MKVIVFGSTDFTLRCLKTLLDYRDIFVPLVVSTPDTKRDRKGNIVASAVSGFCIEEGVDIIQPQNVNAPEVKEKLASYNADVFLVVAYGQILSEEILCLPSLGAFNVHASLLPHYRGASPIEHALLDGVRLSGVTLQKMVKEMDAGDIVLQGKIEIDKEWTYEELYPEVINAGASLVRRFLDNPVGFLAEAKKQNEEEVTYCYKITKEMGEIDWRMNAHEIINRVRAFAKWPVCFTKHNGKILRIYRAKIAPQKEILGVEKKQDGVILAIDKNDGVVIKAEGGLVCAYDLQLEGKRRQDAKSFVNGCRLAVGDILG